MFFVKRAGRKVAAVVLVLLGLMQLSACDQTLPQGGPRIDLNRPVPVALLVPRGSPSANDQGLAQSLENAARLAIAELGGVKIDLRVYPTAANPEQAAQAATQAVADGARIILGPVYAQNAVAAGMAVAKQKINVLAFSNNPEIAGGNVFILGNTFDNTARRLVGFGAAGGRGDIHVAYGQNAAERAGRDAILRAITLTPGARLAGETPFELSQTGVINAVPQIVSDVRLEGANALFLASGTAGALPYLAQLLPENGLDPADVQYIGLQRWDIPASARTLPGLQGGWFALPDPDLSAQFESRYEAAFGSRPHPIAGLAYDGIAAIGALVRTGQADALSAKALTQAAGFVGVDGVFRFLPDGTNERALAVASLQDGAVVIVDPAPKSFGGAGL